MSESKPIRILICGAGGVGTAAAHLLSYRDFFEQVILCDYDLENAKRAVSTVRPENKPERFVADFVDASKAENVEACIRKHKATYVLNGCDPRFNLAIMDGCHAAGANYLDCAMTLSTPYDKENSHIELGDVTFQQHEKWEKNGILAFTGLGIEPGFSDIVAKNACKNIFDEVEYCGVRDGSNLSVDGYGFAPSFSIWTTLEECLNPPIVYTKEKGVHKRELFSDPEVFEFPAGIGECECVNVEHEETVLMGKYLGKDYNIGRADFKYGLGTEFINVLKSLYICGLSSTKPIDVKGVKVAPRDVVAACLPNPATLGPIMHGSTCAGTLVIGKDKVTGKKRAVYYYNVMSNEWSMEKYGDQVVVLQTAFVPVLALELLAKGVWKASGVRGPEYFEPEPFLELMKECGFELGIAEHDPDNYVKELKN